MPSTLGGHFVEAQSHSTKDSPSPGLSSASVSSNFQSALPRAGRDSEEHQLANAVWKELEREFIDAVSTVQPTSGYAIESTSQNKTSRQPQIDQAEAYIHQFGPSIDVDGVSEADRVSARDGGSTVQRGGTRGDDLHGFHPVSVGSHDFVQPVVVLGPEQRGDSSHELQGSLKLGENIQDPKQKGTGHQGEDESEMRESSGLASTPIESSPAYSPASITIFPTQQPVYPPLPGGWPSSPYYTPYGAGAPFLAPPPQALGAHHLSSPYFDEWSTCARRVWEHEEATTMKWKDDLSSMLVFAGLFSIVLAIFNIYHYASLQPLSFSTTAQVLTLISLQSNMHSPNAGLTSPVLPASMGSSQVLSIQSIAISGLWLSALILSLCAASITISANQWLNFHRRQPVVPSRQSVRIWHFRRRGLVKWRVPSVIGVPPVLLQISLALFLIGLVIFLWPFDLTIGIIATALVSLALAISVGTAIIPAFAADCAYKSSEAWCWFHIIQNAKALLRFVAEAINTKLHSHSIYQLLKVLDASLKVKNWRQFESFALKTSKMDDPEDLTMLVDVDAVTLDNSFLETTMRRVLLQCSDPANVLSAYHVIMEHRAHSIDDSNPPVLDWRRSEMDDQSVVVLGNMSLDVLSKIAGSDMSDVDTHQLRILDILHHLLDAMPSTQPETYQGLVQKSGLPDISRRVRSEIFTEISYFSSKFELKGPDVHEMITQITSFAREVELSALFQLLRAMLHLAGKLRLFDSKAFLDDVRRTLSAVMKSVQAAMDESSTKSEESDAEVQRSLRSLSVLVDEVIPLARSYPGLITADLTTSLSRFASKRMNYISLYSTIQHGLDELHKTGNPIQPQIESDPPVKLPPGFLPITNFDQSSYMMV
ncbi:uncharacterized protein FIBRA_00834 [Fibroporia radiculosa]|uniref:DUF6535 domain-containing protein n=1 Tax=Fibroporia radiculosa TaxID=599839 RepID=J4H0R9_9APHY|nr:uncharacterized protein FIBRA_00834 [Fibroporia radiculosa]CCL98829.1 predicted protein [Fibroporia radiculosa]